MKNQTATVTQHLVGCVEAHPSRNPIFLIAAEVVPAQAADEVEPFVQGDLVGGIDTEAGRIGERVDSEGLGIRGLTVIGVIEGGGWAGAGIAHSIQALPGQLDAAAESVPEAEGVEPPGKIGLGVPDGFRGVPLRPVSGDAGDDRSRTASGRSGAYGYGYARVGVPVDVAETKSATKIQIVAEPVVEADSANIGHSPVIVVIGQAIPGIPGDPDRFPVEKRKTVVRNVVFVL